MKKCPFCNEAIQSNAIICCHCSQWLDKSPAPLSPSEKAMPGKPSPDRRQNIQEASRGKEPEEGSRGGQQETSGGETSRASMPRDSFVFIRFDNPIIRSQYHMSLHWAYLAAAFAVTVFITILRVQGRIDEFLTAFLIYMILSVLWIYITIEAWRFLGWKGLLPFAIFLPVSILLMRSMEQIRIYSADIRFLMLISAFNLAGLTMIWLLLHNQSDAGRGNLSRAAVPSVEAIQSENEAACGEADSAAEAPISMDGRRPRFSGTYVISVLVIAFLVVWGINTLQRDEQPPEPAKVSAPAPVPVPVPAEIWLDRARALCPGGKCTDPQKAIEYLGEAIRVKPDFASAYAYRGYIYSELDRHQSAIEDYGEAIRLKPDFAAAYNNRGFTYSRQKQYGLAIRDYDEAIRLKRDFAAPHHGRGVAYILSGNIGKGCRSLVKACQLGKCQGYEWGKQKGHCR